MTLSPRFVVLLALALSVSACGHDAPEDPADASAVYTCVDRATLDRVDDSLCPDRSDDDLFWLGYPYYPYYYPHGVLVPPVGEHSSGGSTKRPAHTTVVKVPSTGRVYPQDPQQRNPVIVVKPQPPVVKAPPAAPVRPVAPPPAAPATPPRAVPPPPPPPPARPR